MALTLIAALLVQPELAHAFALNISAVTPPPSYAERLDNRWASQALIAALREFRFHPFDLSGTRVQTREEAAERPLQQQTLPFVISPSAIAWISAAGFQAAAIVLAFLGYPREAVETFALSLGGVFLGMAQGSVPARYLRSDGSPMSGSVFLQFRNGGPFHWTGAEGTLFEDPLDIRYAADTSTSRAQALGITVIRIEVSPGRALTLQLAGNFPNAYTDPLRWRQLLFESLRQEGQSWRKLFELPERKLTVILADDYPGYGSGFRMEDAVFILHRRLFSDPEAVAPENHPASAAIARGLILSALAHGWGNAFGDPAIEIPEVRAARDAENLAVLTPHRYRTQLHKLMTAKTLQEPVNLPSAITRPVDDGTEHLMVLMRRILSDPTAPSRLSPQALMELEGRFQQVERTYKALPPADQQAVLDKINYFITSDPNETNQEHHAVIIMHAKSIDSTLLKPSEQKSLNQITVGATLHDQLRPDTIRCVEQIINRVERRTQFPILISKLKTWPPNETIRRTADLLKIVSALTNTQSMWVRDQELRLFLEFVRTLDAAVKKQLAPRFIKFISEESQLHQGIGGNTPAVEVFLIALMKAIATDQPDVLLEFFSSLIRHQQGLRIESRESLEEALKVLLLWPDDSRAQKAFRSLVDETQAPEPYRLWLRFSAARKQALTHIRWAPEELEGRGAKQYRTHENQKVATTLLRSAWETGHFMYGRWANTNLNLKELSKAFVGHGPMFEAAGIPKFFWTYTDGSRKGNILTKEELDGRIGIINEDDLKDPVSMRMHYADVFRSALTYYDTYQEAVAVAHPELLVSMPPLNPVRHFGAAESPVPAAWHNSALGPAFRALSAIEEYAFHAATAELINGVRFLARLVTAQQRESGDAFERIDWRVEMPAQGQSGRARIVSNYGYRHPQKRCMAFNQSRRASRLGDERRRFVVSLTFCNGVFYQRRD
jgi:hypothetical protein